MIKRIHKYLYRIGRSFFLIAVLCGVSICIPGSRDWYLHRREESRINAIITSMDLTDKIGQLMMVAIRSRTMHHALEEQLACMKPGGIVLFGNALSTQEQIRSIIIRAQDICSSPVKLPLFVAVDQEGGKVNRVGLGLTHIPGNMAISVTGSEEYARIAGEINGMELAYLGINVNLAPCVDVLEEATNEVIGTRSFGSEILPVSRFSQAYFRGLKKSCVLGCAKHFPNHGAVREDSHAVLPFSGIDSAALEAYLLPYRLLIKNDIDMIMPAHINWAEIDHANVAGTFSDKMILGVLREKLGYNGVVISDAMEMHAVTRTFSPAEAAVRFILAGGDIILFSQETTDLESMRAGIFSAIERGMITEHRINKSVRRILRLKLRMHDQRADFPALPAVTWEANRQLAYRIARESIRRYGTWGTMPVITEDTRMLLISSSLQWQKIAAAAFKKADFMKIPRYPRHADILICAVEKRLSQHAYRLVGMVCENKKQSEQYQYLLSQLKGKLPYIIIFAEDLSSLLNPFYEQQPLIVLWGPSEFSRRAALEEILLKHVPRS